MKTLHDATLAQVRAANPNASTWVAANAGSGKTRVLTDRVARLLLAGTQPQKILCLTYTKAAASHMQNQLFSRLGEWAMLDDEVLVERLGDLGVDPRDLTADDLRGARTLFARALETPGGLKIQTIHSFCAALLRRFPLEAGVSPQFKEIDDRSGRQLRSQVLDALSAGANRALFDAMAQHLSGEDPDGLVQEISSRRQAFDHRLSADDIWAQFGLRPGYTAQDLLDETFAPGDAMVVSDLLAALKTGSSADLKAHDKLRQLSVTPPRLDVVQALESSFLFGPKTKNPNLAKIDAFPTKATRDANPDLMPALNALMQRIEAARPLRQSLYAAQKTLALHNFAHAFLGEYTSQKQINGWLDFDDLIHKVRDLLTETSMAQWVLFRLDGGIDHILVDEAQDTSPAQWDVVAKLAEEFTAGDSARDVERTIFVVGDEKQSIYSFQGADPKAFGEMRALFDDRLTNAGTGLNSSELLFSFRSAEPILALVDNILEGQAGESITTDVKHRAFHSDLPGRVDLWPFVEKDPAEAQGDWFEPVDQPAPNDPSIELANRIADQISASINGKELLSTTKGSRPVEAGDFLILVQQRSDLFHEIIRALKDRGVPVAGADRLKIGGELAVKDLTAFLTFASTPEDDLSLACMLRSPLFGLSEGQLFSLAHGRRGTLWEALRNDRESHSEVVDDLFDILSRADFQRPYELLERILTKLGGRPKLIARLGAEAEDGIDALLSQSLLYEQTEPPTLSGFLGWLAEVEVEIKRQMETHSAQVRVMTVHGAKGLESPVVVLADTAKKQRRNRNEICLLDGGFAAWKTAKPDSTPQIVTALDEQQTLQDEERMRLLYVALTRAENWLIVCGAGDRGGPNDSWYGLVESGMNAVAAVPVDFFGEQGLRYESDNWGEGDAVAVASSADETSPLPTWINASPPAPTPEPKVFSPSNLGGAKVVADQNEGQSSDAALRYGRQIHRLLEILPQHSQDAWPALAKKILKTGDDAASTGEAATLLAEATKVLTSPHLRQLFDGNSLAEVGISARLSGLSGNKIMGFIDRLVVSENTVLAVDFKTNAVVPEAPENVPDGLLRQMGAYSEALELVYPNRAIETAILWTGTAELMRLPHDIVREALKASPTS